MKLLTPQQETIFKLKHFEVYEQINRIRQRAKISPHEFRYYGLTLVDLPSLTTSSGTSPEFDTHDGYVGFVYVKYLATDRSAPNPPAGFEIRCVCRLDAHLQIQFKFADSVESFFSTDYPFVESEETIHWAKHLEWIF